MMYPLIFTFIPMQFTNVYGKSFENVALVIIKYAPNLNMHLFVHVLIVTVPTNVVCKYFENVTLLMM